MTEKSKKEEYLIPTNDFVFKRIFGYEGNEEITKDLISAILGRKIKKIELKNPFLLREFRDDKEEVLWPKYDRIVFWP